MSDEQRTFEFQFLFGKIGELSVHVDVNAPTLAEALARINDEAFEDRLPVDPDDMEGCKIAGVVIGIPEAAEAHVSLVYGPLDEDDCRAWSLEQYKAEFEPT